MNHKLVIFDWDGTLVDSTDMIVRCVQGAYQSMDKAVPDTNAVKGIIGLGLREGIETLSPGLADEMIAHLTEGYRQHFVESDKGHLPVFDGIPEFLSLLSDQGRSLSVATGKSRRGLDRSLARFSHSHLFQLTLCADETASKPNPLMLERTLDFYGLQPDQAIMIGDSVHDLKMAEDFGMDSIGVTYGVATREDLLPFNPLQIVDDVSSLSEIFK